MAFGAVAGASTDRDARVVTVTVNDRKIARQHRVRASTAVSELRLKTRQAYDFDDVTVVLFGPDPTWYQEYWYSARSRLPCRIVDLIQGGWPRVIRVGIGFQEAFRVGCEPSLRGGTARIAPKEKEQAIPS